MPLLKNTLLTVSVVSVLFVLIEGGMVMRLTRSDLANELVRRGDQLDRREDMLDGLDASPDPEGGGFTSHLRDTLEACTSQGDCRGSAENTIRDDTSGLDPRNNGGIASRLRGRQGRRQG